MRRPPPRPLPNRHPVAALEVSAERVVPLVGSFSAPPVGRHLSTAPTFSLHSNAATHTASYPPRYRAFGFPSVFVKT